MSLLPRKADRRTVAPSRSPSLSCAAAIALSLLSTAACTTVDDPESPDHLRAVVLPYLTMVPLHIAAEEGFFADQNLDVEFITLPRNQDIMAALARGEVDVAAGMITVNELALAASGARVRMVGDLGRLAPGGCTFAAFLTRREHVETGALQDAARLRELVFDADILIPFGYWIDELLRPMQLTIDDLNIVNLPSPAAVEALANGSIDVTLDSEPFLVFHDARDETVVWRPAEHVVPDYTITVLMYGPTLLDGDPDVGERFAIGMLEGIRQYRQGKTRRNREIVERATGLSAEQVSTACWPEIPADGRLEPSSFLGYQEWNVARGLVDRVLAEDELFDLRFLEAANAAAAR